MKRLLQTIMVASALVAGALSATVPMQQQVSAVGCTGKQCVTNGAGNVNTGSSQGDVPGAIKAITNILLFLLGAVAVIMLVIGGFKYVVSNGNAEQIKSAKNTILYAIVGLVVAILAYAAVTWIVDKL